MPVKRAGGEIDTRIIYTAEHPALVRETGRLQRAYDLLRFEKEREHPVLAAFAEERGAHSLGVIARGTSDEEATVLGRVLDDRSANIRAVKERLSRDPSAVWELRPVVEKTKDDLGIEPGGLEDRLIEDHLAGIESQETWTKVTLGVVAAGLGLVGVFAPPALIAAGATVEAGLLVGLATATNVALTLDHLDEYRPRERRPRHRLRQGTRDLRRGSVALLVRSGSDRRRPRRGRRLDGVPPAGPAGPRRCRGHSPARQ